jgi:plastocyanin
MAAESRVRHGAPRREDSMRSRGIALVLAAAFDIALFALIIGCSGKDDGGGVNNPGVGPLNSGNFGAGQSYAFTFTAAGSFNYECTNHPGMHGNITVDAGSANDSLLVTAGGASNVFNPVNGTVKPNGYVRWINAGGVHNVTSH